MNNNTNTKAMPMDNKPALMACGTQGRTYHGFFHDGGRTAVYRFQYGG